MKILLIDDHKLFAKSLKVILESDSRIAKMDTINEIKSDIIDFISSNMYDIVLVDINLNNLTEQSGLELAKRIIKACPMVKVAILTGYNRIMYELEAYNMGACAFIDKNIEPNMFIDKVLDVYDGVKCFSDSAKQNYCKGLNNEIKNKDGTLHVKLTEQEINILYQFKLGYGIDVVSSMFGISKRTVSNHINNIYSKLYVSNRQSAITEADRLGYFKIETDLN